MKTKLFILSVIFSICAAYAQAPQFQWGTVVRSNEADSESATTTAYDVKANADGDIFIFGTFNSHATGGFKFANYNHYDALGTFTQTASPNGALITTSVSGNPNLVLYKMNRQGKIIWQVTSNRGYVDGHYSQFLPTADGGALLALTVRFAGNNEFEDNRLIRIVSANGSTTAGSVTRSPYENNTDQGVLVKISAAGQTEWTRHFVRVDEARVAGNLANTAIYFNDLVAGDDGNYWVAGRYTKNITLDRPDGSTLTLSPTNVEGWNGDAQQSRGDALLLKIDPQGKYLWHLENDASSGIDYQSINSAHHHEGTLFLYGNIAATIDSENPQTTLFGHTIAPTDKTNAWSAAIDITQEQPQARWVTLFKSLPQTNGKGGRIKVTKLAFDNDALFLCGSITGIVQVNGISILANDATTDDASNYLMGFFIRQNPLNGEIISYALDPSLGLAAEIETVAFRKNRIYAYGYTLGSSWLHVYDEGLNLAASHNLITAGGATAWDALFLDDRFITVNRGRQMGVLGGTIAGAPQAFIADAPVAYSAYLLAYGLDGLRETALPPVAVPHDKLRIVARPNALRITTNGYVRILSVTGTRFYEGYVNGEKEIALPAGIYVVAANNGAVKAIVK
jgi:hypothetical protein